MNTHIRSSIYRTIFLLYLTAGLHHNLQAGTQWSATTDTRLT